MRIFYKTLLCFSAVLVTLVSCSFDEIGDQITLENTKINIAFDREKFDFQKMQQLSDPDTIAIGDSLVAEAVIDSNKVSFGDLRVGGQNYSNLGFGYPFGPISGTLPADTLSYTISGINSGMQPDFIWANITNGKMFIDVKNEMLNSLTIKFTLLNNQDAAILDTTLSPTNMSIFFKTDSVYLSGKKLTSHMKMKIDFSWPNQTVSGLDDKDSLKFNFRIGECTFSSAYAKFANNIISDDSLYTFEVKNITEVREMIAKNAGLRVKIRNNSNFYLDMISNADSIFNLRTNTYINQLELQNLSPNTTGYLTPDIDLDSCRIRFVRNIVNGEIKHGIRLKSKTICKDQAGPGSGMIGYVLFDQTQEAWVIVSMQGKQKKKNKKSRSSSDTDIHAYRIDGKMVNSVTKIEGKARELGDDINWDEYNGINADSLSLKIMLDINRSSLVFSQLKIDSLFVQGKKKNGQLSEPVLLLSGYLPGNLPILNNVNDAEIAVTGLEKVINFHPDSIVYNGNIVTTYDGLIYDTDLIETKFGFGVPLQVQATVPAGQAALTQSSDVDSLDAINDNENLNIEAVKIDLDAFINNPKAIDIKMRLTVKISDEIVKTFDTENDSLVGNIDTLMTVLLQKDYKGSTSYMVSNLMGNKPVELKKEAITRMLKNKTYIQQTLEVISQGPGHPIIMKPEDFIEVQLKLSGDLNVTFDTK